jgi:hypothetical protein
VQFPPPVGPQPAIVLTTNALITRLGAVTVAEVTSTAGPSWTHIEVPPEVGLTGPAGTTPGSTSPGYIRCPRAGCTAAADGWLRRSLIGWAPRSASISTWNRSDRGLGLVAPEATSTNSRASVSARR